MSYVVINAPITSETQDQLSVDAYQRRIARLENEKTELSRKLMEATRTLQKHYHGTMPGQEATTAEDSQMLAQLKDEVQVCDTRKLTPLHTVHHSQILKARLVEAESAQTKSKDVLQQAGDEKKEDWEKKYKELKTKHHALMLERTEMMQVRLAYTNVLLVALDVV